MTSRQLYLLLVLAVALERLVELVLARRNAARLRARGGHEAGVGHYPVMVALHTGFLVACAVEVTLAERPFHAAVGVPMLVLVVAAMALRYWVVATLGDRWTTRVIVVPGEPVVVGGPYRWLRHPNYLAVVVEIVALPLVHGAWLTALVFSAANALLLTVRIRVEEQALGESSDYRERFAATRSRGR